MRCKLRVRQRRDVSMREDPDVIVTRKGGTTTWTFVKPAGKSRPASYVGPDDHIAGRESEAYELGGRPLSAASSPCLQVARDPLAVPVGGLPFIIPSICYCVMS